MRAAQLDGSTVINLIEVNALDDLPNLLAASSANIGDTWNGSAFIPSAIPLPTEKQYIDAVQNLLDKNAQRLGYDGIMSAATYAGDSNATFNAQGTALKTWRSNIWAACYSILAQVQAKTLAQPTLTALLAMLPACPL